MKLRLIFIFVAGLLCQCGNSQNIIESNIRNHIKILASDSLEGRGAGSKGEQMAAAYIQKQFSDLHLVPKGVDNSYSQPFTFTSGVHGTGEQKSSSNLVAYLDNEAATTIIIGAHYDHLGLGGGGNSLEANSDGMIHNGADDNASGVAGVLELARYFQSNKVKEKNNFLFILFSAEELGLFGSKYFADNPTIDMNHVTYMINLDMVGRLDSVSKALSVSGTGTSPAWEPALAKLSTPEVKIKTDSSGTGPSDHTSFYLKNIPVLHFFTGSHRDYHKPSDDWEKINYAGEVDVLKIIVALILDLESQPKLAFLTTKSKSMSTASSFKVTLGIMPSYTSSEKGLQVDGVSEGRPAFHAGIKTGDLIIKMGDMEINDIQNYMEALGKFEKGQTIPVKVKRGDEIVELMVTF
jgi:Zn-dependent M28 family amino/carboxypeptidase